MISTNFVGISRLEVILAIEALAVWIQFCSVSGMPTSRTQVKFRRQWDAVGWQTSALRPKHCFGILLHWPVDPKSIDKGVPETIKQIVAATIASLGPVAFRVFFEHTLSANTTIIPATRRFLPWRIIERLTRQWPVDLAIARTTADVQQLFEQQWQLQGQVALVLSASFLSWESLESLQRVRDWSRQEFPPEALLLIAPAVDGDGLLLVGKNRDVLASTQTTLSSAFCNAGLEVKIVFNSSSR
jgi:hypothetical protein